MTTIYSRNASTRIVNAFNNTKVPMSMVFPKERRDIDTPIHEIIEDCFSDLIQDYLTMRHLVLIISRTMGNRSIEQIRKCDGINDGQMKSGILGDIIEMARTREERIIPLNKIYGE